MSPQYPARLHQSIAASTDEGGGVGGGGGGGAWDAQAAQFTAYLDRLEEGGLDPGEVRQRVLVTGMANHEPLRSWLELWHTQHAARRGVSRRGDPLRENVQWFADKINEEMTRQAYAQQQTQEHGTLPPAAVPALGPLGAPLGGLGRAAPTTVPLYPSQTLLTQGDPANRNGRNGTTFFTALDRLHAAVDRLPALFWQQEQVDVQLWIRHFISACAAVAVEALRMAGQSARYYAQRTATHRAPF